MRPPGLSKWRVFNSAGGQCEPTLTLECFDTLFPSEEPTASPTAQPSLLEFTGGSHPGPESLHDAICSTEGKLSSADFTYPRALAGADGVADEQTERAAERAALGAPQPRPDLGPHVAAELRADGGLRHALSHRRERHLRR